MYIGDCVVGDDAVCIFVNVHKAVSLIHSVFM